jgi:hypothetical protein
MEHPMPRALLSAAIALLVVPLLTAMPADADPPGPAAVPSSDYVDRVNEALRQTDDHWGEKLLKRPDGPTFESLQSLLLPAYQANNYLTDSSWVYLPQTYPAPEPNQWGINRPFSLHVIDGSQLISNWAEQDAHLPRRTATFQVGGSEIYGSRTDALVTPALTGGHLPILANSYTDAAGIKWERESFAGRQNGKLVSWVKFTAYGAKSTSLKVKLVGSGVAGATVSGQRLVGGGQTYLGWSGSASWAGDTLTMPVNATAAGTSVYLLVPNNPADVGAPAIDGTAYGQAKSGITQYWEGLLAQGAKVEIPEQYAAEAMRNLLIQNLVMGWQQSVGNGYEFTDDNQAFVPEVSASVQVLGEFGQQAAYRKHLQEILRRGQGEEFFPGWEMGIKMQSAASYYELTGDASYLTDNLSTFNGYLTRFAAERDADPNGLVAKTRYGSDIPEPVYGLHHQTEAWKGLRDLGRVLTKAGRTTDGARFSSEASEFEMKLRSAISRSQTWLPDGSLYVPISLLDGNAPAPYKLAASTKDGSYWNLTIGYFAATGLFAPGSAEAKGLTKFIATHGALFLGLTRFNLTGIDPGVCWGGSGHFGDSAPGYKSSGVDEQYGYSRVKFLSDNAEADRLTLNLYGKLAHDLTPKTFIGGEGTSVGPCPELGENYRTQFYPPLSANNATYLEALRSALVREEFGADGGASRLWITPAAPRPWLADGKKIAVEKLPTKFGPLAYKIESHLADGYVDATVTPSRSAAVKLALRPPAGYQLTSVTVGGATREASGEVVDLGVISQATTVRANYRTVAVPRADQAEVTVIAGPTESAQRAVFQPGQTVSLNPTVEVLGTARVPGKVSLGLPAGWTVPAAVPFDLASDGKIAWGKVPVSFTVPVGVAPGEYKVRFVATPLSGEATTTEWVVRVGKPSATAYADLVKRDGPTAYWRLGESGSTFADSSPYNTVATAHDQVATGQPGALVGDGDGAVRLNGGYVDTPHSLAVTPSGPSTFEAWLKVTQAYQQGILEKYNAPGNNGFALRLVDRNVLQLSLLGAGGQASVITGKHTLLPGLYHHVVVAYDTAWMDIYVDGRLEFRTPAGGMPTVGNSPLRIGARGDDAAFRLNGWVDEVAMYPGPLTATQVEEHYLRGVLGAPLG